MMQPNQEQEYDNCPTSEAMNANPTINQLSEEISELSDQQLKSVVGGLGRHQLTDDQLESVWGKSSILVQGIGGF